MYKLCTTAHTVKQQRHFEECLMKLLIQKSFHEITVSALCQEAGVSRFTFYRLFDGKEDVLDAIVDRTLLNWLNEDGGELTDIEQLYESSCQFFSYWQKQKPLLDALSVNKKSSLLVERCMLYLIHTERDVTRYFLTDKEEYAEEVLQFCLNGIFGLVTCWHQNGFRKSAEQMAEILVDLLQAQLLHPLKK